MLGEFSEGNEKMNDLTEKLLNIGLNTLTFVKGSAKSVKKISLKLSFFGFEISAIFIRVR